MSGPCSQCGTTAREVLWSWLVGARVCLRCYLPHAPDDPEWTPYVPPKERPNPRTLAVERVHRAMNAVAPANFTNTGVVGTCPLCRHTLDAHVHTRVMTLTCDGGCPEEAVWKELRL